MAGRVPASRCSSRRSSSAACVAWVLTSDATFQDAAEEVAARKAQQPGPRAVNYRARATGWTLAPTGTRRGRVRLESGDADLARRRHAEPLSGWRPSSCRDHRRARSAFGRARGLPAIVGVFALAGAGFAVLMAPQILRVDLRQDLQAPRAPQDVAGQGVGSRPRRDRLAGRAADGARLDPDRDRAGPVVREFFDAWRSACGSALRERRRVVAPALVFAQLTIHNGVALMFPGVGAARQPTGARARRDGPAPHHARRDVAVADHHDAARGARRRHRLVCVQG